MFTNKHVVVAMLVAPVLAIMAWFAIDYFVAERPHAAKSGASYKLIAKSNCRYDSGQCDLENGDFKLTIRSIKAADSEISLELVSRFPLQQATIGLVDGGREQLPSILASTDASGVRWSTTLAHPTSSESAIRVAVVAGESTYYAEVPVVFMQQAL